MDRLSQWAQRAGLARSAMRRRRPAATLACQGPYANDCTLVGADGERRQRRASWFRARYPGESAAEYWLDVLHTQLAPHRDKLFGALAVLVGALVLLLLVDVSASRDERAAVGGGVHEARGAYAPRVAEQLALYTPDAPLRAATERLEYAQLRGERPLPDGGSLERAMSAARELLATSDEPCACAPMFGARASYLAVRRDDDAAAGTPLHLFNVRDEARPAFDDPARVAELGALSLVEHTHDALFDWPGHDAQRALRVVRRDVLPLRVTALSGVERALTLRGRAAHCACACLDLIDGVALWERALRQQPLLETTETAALAYAARVQKLLAGADLSE